MVQENVCELQFASRLGQNIAIDGVDLDKLIVWVTTNSEAQLGDRNLHSPAQT